MSVFNKVVGVHSQAKTDSEQAAAAAAAALKTVETDFLAKFHAQIEAIAKPIFEKFVADAIEYGFPAKTESQKDGNSNPTYSLSLIPVAGAKFGVNPSDICTFRIKGIIADQKVEHTSYFDQRPKKNGINQDVFGIPSINKELLERELGEFLNSTLNARKA